MDNHNMGIINPLLYVNEPLAARCVIKQQVAVMAKKNEFVI